MYSTGKPCPAWAPRDRSTVAITFDSDGETHEHVVEMCDDMNGSVRLWANYFGHIFIAILHEDGTGNLGGSTDSPLHTFKWKARETEVPGV